MTHKIDDDIIRKCYQELKSLHDKAIDLEKEYSPVLQSLEGSYNLSARNLIHYLAVRQCDIRDLQIELSYMGLSSLGRLEAHVMAGLKSVLYALNCMSGGQIASNEDIFHYVHFKEGDNMLREHTEKLFGLRPPNRNVRIMVTLPVEAAADYSLVLSLLRSGMNVARINAAHDDEHTWSKMIFHVRKASKELDRSCKVLFDLEGPKLRTGAISGNTKSSGNLISDQVESRGNSKKRAIRLKEGDWVKITSPESPGRKAVYDDSGDLLIPASIPCTLPEIFDQVNVHDRIFFDDGKIGGIVEEIHEDGLMVKIKKTSKKEGTKLRSDKGINLPDTALKIEALSNQDLSHLDFALQHVDLIGLSFVKEPQDVFLLQDKITAKTDREIGIILKIETKLGFDNLSQLLLAGLRRPPLGVMVARGDLGVEVGFERMSEVQEQILWLCEAAHVPVIWATQVLDQMNKTGLPTRGEVTDAAMSSRAECVMLNKGPYIVETVKFLDNILVRMMDHNNKKTPMLRKLKVSEGRFPGTGLKKVI